MSQDELEHRLYGLDFDAGKSMRYHLCRRRFWDTCNRLNKILGTLSGSAVIVGITSGTTILTTTSGAIVAVFSTLDLVFDFSERARGADNLYRQWSLYAQEITQISSPTIEHLAKLQERRLQIEMEEGPVMDLLERRCCYDEAKARGAEVRPAWNLRRWQRRFAQFIFWRPAGL